MAEAEAPHEGGGSAFGFLGKKMFGKVPVWVLAVAAVGAYYWYTRYGPGKSGTNAATAAGVQGTDPAGNTGVIDPATGYVYGTPEDSAALNAAQQTGPDTGPPGPPGPQGPPGAPGPQHGIIPGGPGEGGPGPKVVPFRPGVGHIGEGRLPVPKPPRKPPGKKPPRKTAPTLLPVSAASKNEEWGGNAVSNLISQGVPPDQASAAIQTHLNGEPLSPAMAANRDLAIASVGPPPEVPAPAHVGGNVA